MEDEEVERGRDEEIPDAEPNPQDLKFGSALDSCSHPAELSPSSLSLLALPWEMVVRIASHLPAQCVVNVLPQVCRALRHVGEDTSAWQLRADRLTGPQTSFPVGPREQFDWPTACLEMEQLIERWVKVEEGTESQQPWVQPAGADGAERQADAASQETRHDDTAPPGGEEEERGGDMDNDLEVEIGNSSMEEELNHEEQGPGERRNEWPSSPQSVHRVRLQAGHIADVNTVLLIGGEGSVCASGSRDRNVNLWDIRRGSTGLILNTLVDRGVLGTTHRGWVWCLAGSGDLLASGSLDSTIKLWDLQAGGAKLQTLKSHSAVLCMSYQQHMLFAGTHNQNVNIYDTRVAEPLIKSHRLHTDAVMCLVSDERYILSGSKDNTVAVFDRRAGRRLKKHHLNSYLRAMSCSGREVWAGDNRGLLYTFAMNEGTFKSVAQFNVKHSSPVTGIHYSPGALYTCSSDHTAKVHLPCAPPKTLRTLQHLTGVNGLSVEAGVLAVASGDCVEVWRPTQ